MEGTVGAEVKTGKCTLCGSVEVVFYWMKAIIDECNEKGSYDETRVPVCENCAVNHYWYPNEEDRELMDDEFDLQLRYRWETVSYHDYQEKRKREEDARKALVRRFKEENADRDEPVLKGDRCELDDEYFEDDSDYPMRKLAERAIARLKFRGEISIDEMLDEDF